MPTAKAGLNQVFICKVCAKTFLDRAAKISVPVAMKGCVVGVAKMVPHAKYPNDADLATLVYQDAADQAVEIPESDAAECCATQTALCSASHIRFRKELDGTLHIVGAEYLE